MRPGPFTPIEATLDLVTPPDMIRPGRAIAAKNYEPLNGGAGRFPGYERFDGQPKPSDQSYWILDFDQSDTEVSAGDTVTGVGSGETGIAVIDGVLESGSYAGSDAAGYLVLREVGTTGFNDDENLQVSAATVAVANGTERQRGGDTTALDTTYLRAAIEAARALIAKPTGSGGILGVWKFKGVRYSFRNNAGGTAALMYKSTAAGWVQVDLGYRVAFTSGSTEIAEGDTLTGATSSSTAVARRIIVTSGAWDSGDAAGFLILYSKSGAMQAEDLDNTTQAASNVCSIAADSIAQELAAGGRYRFRTHNFYGATNLTRMYGVNGVNQAFEFDGSYFVLISTGMTSDLPKFIGIYKNQLILAFAGGSVQTSSIGEPLLFNVLLGASEIGVGAEVTNLLNQWNDSLVISARTQIKVLYGNDSDDFVLDESNGYAGAYADSMILVGVPIYCDDTGIRKLTQGQVEFGNFELETLSWLVEPFLEAKRKNGVSITCSIDSKRKGQYRLFFDDNSALFLYFGQLTKEGYPRILPIEMDHVVSCICGEICQTGEDANEEVILFGSDDGMVYEMDVGTSFDGDTLQAHYRLPWDNQQRPNWNKKFQKSVVKLTANPIASIVASADFSGGDPDRPSVPETSYAVDGGGGIWNKDNWNDFLWSSRAVGQAVVRAEGVGTDISLSVISESIYEKPHILHSVQHFYSQRGLVRGAV